MKLLEISREELYEQVWTTPISKLSKKYGLSDQGLAKKCKKHQIPRPPVGYWAKLANGKNVSKPPLPVITDTDLQVVLFDMHTQTKRPVKGELSLEQHPEIKTAKSFSVPNQISSYHPLVKASIEAFKERTTDRYGFLIPHYLKKMRILLNVNTHSGEREHLVYPCIGLVLFLT